MSGRRWGAGRERSPMRAAPPPPPLAMQPRLGPVQGAGPIWRYIEATIGPQGGPMHHEPCLAYCDGDKVLGVWPFAMLTQLGWVNVASLTYLRPMVTL